MDKISCCSLFFRFFQSRSFCGSFEKILGCFAVPLLTQHYASLNPGELQILHCDGCLADSTMVAQSLQQSTETVKGHKPS